MIRVEGTEATPDKGERQVLSVGISLIALCAAAHGAWAQEATPVPPITVTAIDASPTSAPASADGSAEMGYVVHTAEEVGILGSKNILDLPYSIYVVPQALMSNIQASSPEDIYRIIPFTQLDVPNDRTGTSRANIRGFEGNTQILYDGVRSNTAEFVTDLEDIERVEIFTGPNSFLYGNDSSNPGGLTNYVLKRPTSVPMLTFKAGDFGGSNSYASLDAGGPLDQNGIFGVRLNTVIQGGNTAVDYQNLTRNLISGTLDIHPFNDLLIQLNGSHSTWKMDGIIPAWVVLSGLNYPSAPNVSQSWGQGFSYEDNETNRYGAKVNWKLNNIFTFRSEFQYAAQTRDTLAASNIITASNTYETELVRNLQYFSTYGGDALIDADFYTWDVHHKITTGFLGDRTGDYQPIDGIAVSLTKNLSLSAPTFLADPNLVVGTKPFYKTGDGINESYFLGDDIKFNQYFSALLGVADIGIISRGFSTAGHLTSSYDKSALGPSLSVIFKPVPWMSTYFTYSQGLEPGSIATATYNNLPVTNANVATPPVKDSQYEVGVKAEIGPTLLTLALFDITQPSAIYTLNGTSYTFSADATQRNLGVEAGLTGKVTPNLTLYGGVTALNPKIVANPASPQDVGKIPIGVSKEYVKLYAEYSIDQVPGLVLNGQIIYTSEFYADILNAQRVPSYALGYLGARYQTKINGLPTTFRFNVANVVNTNVWLGPNYLGSPRTYSFSAEVKF